MKKTFCFSVLSLILFVSADSPTRALIGFSASNTEVQKKVEARFDQLLEVNAIDSMIKRLSARPHHLGSPYQKANAEYLLKKYREWGYDARIDTFYGLFPTPKIRLLEAASVIKFKASLVEPPLKEDATSSQTAEQLPPYNCYSADGDVTGELIYVNYGVPSDYEQLEKMGVDVKGKIVIARYGGAWRGIKPRLAQEKGAIGCLIYSDPKEDGYYQGDIYPKGAFKNEYGVQRGSVMDMPLYPGDPQTPGYAATRDAKRIDRKDVPTLMKIPVLPISYADARPFLAALTGPVAPDAWRGALPITYHVGPGPVKVHLKLQFNWDVVPVYDVIAVMKGSQRPEEWVIRGNHLDAWVNGADDPIAGQAAMLEEARAIGQLAKEGMKPKRTIIYCSWDGEEEGLIGSTEWVEANAQELSRRAVAYINTDATGRGFLGVGGSHTLHKFVNEVAADVIDPETNISILKRRISRDAAHASSAKEKKELLQASTIKLDALGAGSDFSSFFQHLGIPSLNLGFGGESGGGEYHSTYDSYDMFRRFKDPGFVYEVVLAKTAGRMTLRMANASTLPFSYEDFYATVNDYATEVTRQLDDMRTTTEVENRMINEKHYVFASDPTKTFIPPTTRDDVPYLDFSSLQNSLAELKKSSAEFETLLRDAKLSEPATNKLNAILYHSEKRLLLQKGLPNRPWYKHAIYAPGYHTGYGVKTLPGIREAIESRDWKLAKEQMEEASRVLLAYNQSVLEAIKVLKEK